uniref:PEHE domain-containing protein n=1 Tax=Hydatigena taeniaeformis TaxID=6205 RepID=A0A0R3WKU5_HYDTA
LGGVSGVHSRLHGLTSELCQQLSLECTYTPYVRQKPASLQKRYCLLSVCPSHSDADMLAQKLVDLLPRSSMSRPIFRSFAFERNADNAVATPDPLLYLTGSNHRLPGLVKRPCSPSSVFLKSPTSPSHPKSGRSRSQDRCRQSALNQTLMNASASQENTPPSLKRPAIRIDAVNHISAPCGVSNHRRGAEFRSDRFLVHLVPSWRVNDIIRERYRGDAGVSRVLRSRNSQFTRANFLKRSRPPDGYEDTSDNAYMSRHARLEMEEIKRERLSDQRMAEEELRLRNELRERESWRKRQATRVDSFVDIDPERFMPMSLLEPISKVRYIHVRSHVPLIAFGVKVPRPEFG